MSQNNPLFFTVHAQWHENITNVSNQKVSRWPKRFSFFRHGSSKLCNSFRMVFTQNSSILATLSSAPAHHFFTTFMRQFKPDTEKTMASFASQFSFAQIT